MNRTELIKEVAQRTGKTQVEMKGVFTAIEEAVYEALLKGDDIKGLVTGLNVEVKAVAEREARNPQTGEKIVVPAHKVVKARTTGALKNLLAED